MNLVQLFTLTKEQLIALDPKDAPLFLNDEAIVYIAKKLNAYWQYDYEAAREGKVGYHALLKSGRHSSGFFASRILLQYPNILEIMSAQLVYRYRYSQKQFRIHKPDWVAGIPDGAKKLGEKVAELTGWQLAEMEKADGRINLVTRIPSHDYLLLVEDFCTRATGFKEAVTGIVSQQPFIRLLPYELVLLNRGGLSGILVDGVGPFSIIAAAYYPVDDWDPNSQEGCPLCKMGSIPIKPKVTDENWRLITMSQL